MSTFRSRAHCSSPLLHPARLALLAALLPGAVAGEVPGPAEARQRIALPTLQAADQVLLYAGEAATLHALPLAPSANVPGLAPRAVTNELTLHRWREPSPPPLLTRAELSGTDTGVQPGRAALSPDGSRVAVQVWFGPMPVVWLLEGVGGNRPRLQRMVAEGYGVFLGWHPEGKHALYAARDLDVPDPGLWLVDATDGSHRQLPTPGLVAAEALTAAAFSPDGAALAWAKTDGMGSGSEIWLSENGAAPRVIWRDELTVVASLAWSHDGARLAFTNLLDAPVPFAEAGLWTWERASGEPRFLALVDGGHGQTPAWTMDSRRLLFVGRDNFDDTAANYRAEALVSSIRAVDVVSQKVTIEVPAEGARHLDPTLGPGGELYFASDRGGNLEIWKADAGGKLTQLTASGTPKRHPLLLPSAATSTQPSGR